MDLNNPVQLSKYMVGARIGGSAEWGQARNVWLFGFGAIDTLEDVNYEKYEQLHLIIQPLLVATTQIRHSVTLPKKLGLNRRCLWPAKS